MLFFGWTVPDLWQLGICMNWMEKNMAKKTKKQIAIEKRIKALKTQHGTLSKQKRVLEKRLDAEGKVADKKIRALELKIDRLQSQVSKLENDPLPSEKARRKLTDKLVAVEDQIRTQEQKLRDASIPKEALGDESRRPSREAGDEEE